MKYLKSCLPKGNLLGTTISFIEIGLLYWLNSYSSISVSSNFVIFYPFSYMILIFFIIFKNFFWSKFTDSEELSKSLF